MDSPAPGAVAFVSATDDCVYGSHIQEEFGKFSELFFRGDWARIGVPGALDSSVYDMERVAYLDYCMEENRGGKAFHFDVYFDSVFADAGYRFLRTRFTFGVPSDE
eukprot:1428620-Rhodomonas_salina.1